MILYPTETLYALGVNALDENELLKLYSLKDRDASKPPSWLVRSIADIEVYGVLTPKALKIAECFLPGKLTLVLEAKDTVPAFRKNLDNEVSFRISADKKAGEVVERFMQMHKAPLTCTSANVSGLATLATPAEILQQFGKKAKRIDTIIDDGPRKGLAPTIVRVIGDEVTVLREGDITEREIREVIE
jgi:L-threonylcarbamoyladenylate synthase